MATSPQPPIPEAKPSDISFFHTTPVICPVCRESFQREVMRFGKGRLISLEVDDELRQRYKSSQKYGKVYPFIYNVLVCPNCWFAALTEDFEKKKFYDLDTLASEKKFRITQGREIHRHSDFSEYRTLQTGLVGYFLAILCYTHCLYDNFSHAKKAIAAIRASWCLEELCVEFPKDEAYPALKQYFRYSALLESQRHIDSIYEHRKTKDQKKVELYGPDVNKDMGFDGFLYLNSYLSFEFLLLEISPTIQQETLKKLRNSLSKVFGLGKSSRNKPSILSSKARNLYDNIKADLDLVEENSDEDLLEEPTP